MVHARGAEAFARAVAGSGIQDSVSAFKVDEDICMWLKKYLQNRCCDYIGLIK
jgi:hypothetical protein